MKKLVFASMLLLFAGTASEGWAEFYVIAAGTRAKRTVLVSPQGTETASGTALLGAISKISDASPTNPYLIKIEPGIYNVGTSSFVMKPNVDVEGSGQGVTTIKGNIDSDSAGVVNGANNAELRFLTVENSNGGSNGIAIYNNAVSPSITYVTAVAGTASVTSWGILTVGASPALTHVSVKAYGGAGGDVRALANTGGSSPTLEAVDVYATGPVHNIAIYNEGTHTNPLMKNVTATAYGGTWATACQIGYQAAAAMTGCTFTASGASVQNTGVSHSSDESISLMNVVSRGFDGGGGGSGIGYLVDDADVEIRQSLISGSNYSIQSQTIASSSHVYVFTSQLKSPVYETSSTGTIHCRYCYDGNHSALDNSCAPTP